MELKGLTQKKARLDQLGPLPQTLIQNLAQWFRIELTYTSNAIEGNTLTRQETTLVVEKGLTVGGKSLQEHLEARNHAYAWDWIRSVAADANFELSEPAILHLHHLILTGIDDENAGRYRTVPVRLSGSRVILPNPLKVPEKMKTFITEMAISNTHPVEQAAAAHYDLVTIHPFIDGNGRTARLLMNFILIQHGYPPAIIRKTDRLAYINALESAQLGGSKHAYRKLIYQAVNRSLDLYLKTLAGKSVPEANDTLLKIGELAVKVGETVPTIRHWTKEGLLQIADTLPSGYTLYAMDMISLCHRIQVLKKQHLSLKEIKTRL